MKKKLLQCNQLRKQLPQKKLHRRKQLRKRLSKKLLPRKLRRKTLHKKLLKQKQLRSVLSMIRQPRTKKIMQWKLLKMKHHTPLMWVVPGENSLQTSQMMIYRTGTEQKVQPSPGPQRLQYTGEASS